MANTTPTAIPASDGPGRGADLGMFAGVFTPSILTILGVIMYLRFGWVVGQVGLVSTLVIVTLSTSITLLTALSIAAIATAQDVGGGGAYYMISRSLGIEAGGAVGIPLFFAQALSVALYTIGFAESLVRVFPSLDEKAVAVVTTLGVALVALRSARAAIKAQYVIMAAIVLSLLSLLFGQSVVDEASIPAAAVGFERVGFWTVFAVFFPAVTGIMAGVNMSGDLRNPGRAIPWGTLAAVAAGYVIYMAMPILLVSRATPEQLVADPLIMRRMAFWGDAILVGVWGATLSSAVGSILGAPRVLQALARDRVLPAAFSFLGSGSGPEDQPRAGTAATLGVALATVMLGNLDVVAPILTMFFLTTYGVLNITAGLERFLGNPSFRPRFRVHWTWSMAGAGGCIWVMFLINPVATVAALVIVSGIYLWLERREIKSAWGDVRRGVWLNITRAGLLRIPSEPDVKNWRPHLLVLSGAPTRRWHLVEFASELSHNRGLLTVSSVFPEESVTAGRIDKMTATVNDLLLKHGVRGLVRLVRAPTPFRGARRLVEAYGLGALVPNTLVLGASEREEHRTEYCEMIAYFHRARRNVIIVRWNETFGFGNRKRIDVWWGGLNRNGGLMLILAYLLRTSLPWRGADVVVKMAVPTEDAAEVARRNLDRIIGTSRTGARSEILVRSGRDFQDLLRESSADADLVFLGLAEPGDRFEEYYTTLQKRTAGLPTTAFVLAAEDLAFGEVIC